MTTISEFLEKMRKGFRHVSVGFLSWLTLTSCAQPGGSQALAPVAAAAHVAQGLRWGAVGHDDWQYYGGSYAYNHVTFNQQMALLTGAGLRWYRAGCAGTSCPDVIAAAKKAGVSILGGFALSPDEHVGETDNYKRAYQFAFDKTRADHGDIEYYEAGNEVEDWVGMNGDGSSRTQYKQDRYVQARGMIRGLIDGAHAANASAKVMVDNAGWCHYGFLQMLWEDGVHWDITAFHWYANQGNIEKAGCESANVAAIHASFGRPVWITEYNSDVAAKAGDDHAQAVWIAGFVAQLREVASKYNIQAAFVYELLDEPNLSGMESHLGLADGAGSPKAAYKAVREALGGRAP